MKKSTFIIFILSVFIITYISFSLLNVHNAKKKEGIVLSPNKTKSVEFFDEFGTEQIFMNFHKHFIVGGSNVASGKFDKQNVELEWIEDNTLIIRTPENTIFSSKETKVGFFKEEVKIIYEDIK